MNASLTPLPSFNVLASTSPRRQQLLKAIGLSFKVIVPGNGQGIDETPHPGESPAELVQRLSHLKAQAVVVNLASKDMPPAGQPLIIIAADTVVALHDDILGKPADAAEAARMLKQLRQQAHAVYTGLTVACLRGPERTFITRLHHSTVWMRPYTDAEIAAYVSTGDPLDKAGAYAIQHKTFAPVERLQGCFASVMGLPLGELAAAFTALGLALPPIGPGCAAYNHYPCCQAF